MSPSFDITSYLRMMLEPSYVEGSCCVGTARSSDGKMVYFNISEENKAKFIKEISIRTRHPESAISAAFSKHPGTMFCRAVEDIYKIRYNNVEDCIVGVYGTVGKFLTAKGFAQPQAQQPNRATRMSLIDPKPVVEDVVEPEKVVEPVQPANDKKMDLTPVKGFEDDDEDDVSFVEIPKPKPKQELEYVPESEPDKVEEIGAAQIKKDTGNTRLTTLINARRSRSAKKENQQQQPQEVQEVEPRVEEEPQEVPASEVEEVVPEVIPVPEPVIEEVKKPVVEEPVKQPTVAPISPVVNDTPITTATESPNQTSGKTITPEDFGKQLQSSLLVANETSRYVKQLEDMFLACASQDQVAEYKKTWFLKSEDDLKEFNEFLLPKLSKDVLVKALSKTLNRRWRDGDSKSVSKFVEVFMDFLD